MKMIRVFYDTDAGGRIGTGQMVITSNERDLKVREGRKRGRRRDGRDGERKEGGGRG